MSSFAVEVVRLDDVLPHPNADKLELAVIGGYRAVVQKGLHIAGDAVVYIPEQAVLPLYLQELLGLSGRLAGKAKNRVKAIRLRGELSQGVVLPLDLAYGLAREDSARYNAIYPNAVTVDEASGETEIAFNIGQNLAEFLRIEKYEEEIPVHMQGIMLPRPAWFPMYTDIENIKKHPNVLQPGEQVIVTEKLHGTSSAFGMHRENRELMVSSRRVVLARDPSNLYWRAALQYNIEAFLSGLLDVTDFESIVLFGEIIGPGVQDLAYGVPSGQIAFRAFDLMVDGEYVSHGMMVELLGVEGDAEDESADFDRTVADIPMVPLLYYGPYSPDVVEHYTDGIDTESGTNVREGIVVRPTVEKREDRLGRVILKSVSADYLLRGGNPTERN